MYAVQEADVGCRTELDTVKIEQTYKHPCLFTLTVDEFQSQNGNASPHQDMSQWHLPTPDPSSQGKYMYRLHTVDMYFWTPEDASLFLDSVRRVLQPHQLQITRNPSSATPTHSEHKNDAMSPVIARLENAAISHTSRSASISTTQSFPGPPTAAAPTSPPPSEQPPNFAQMANNPAAPAAQRHRRQKMPRTERVWGLLLRMINMPRNTAIRCRLRLLRSQRLAHTFLDRPPQDRDSLARQVCNVQILGDPRQVHRRARHHLLRHHLLLRQASSTIPHHHRRP